MKLINKTPNEVVAYFNGRPPPTPGNPDCLEHLRAARVYLNTGVLRRTDDGTLWIAGQEMQQALRRLRPVQGDSNGNSNKSSRGDRIRNAFSIQNGRSQLRIVRK